MMKIITVIILSEEMRLSNRNGFVHTLTNLLIMDFMYAHLKGLVAAPYLI